MDWLVLSKLMSMHCVVPPPPALTGAPGRARQLHARGGARVSAVAGAVGQTGRAGQAGGTSVLFHFTVCQSVGACSGTC